MNDRYDTIPAQLEALLGEPEDEVTQLANAAALLYWSVDRVNWAGFYLLRDGELRLGPFHGQPACTRIPVGKGVCGTAAARRETLVVPDVHAFPGHIACDSASNSEIVVPLIVSGELAGVLDVDSPDLDRFGASEQRLFTQCALIVGSALTRDRAKKTLDSQRDSQ